MATHAHSISLRSAAAHPLLHRASHAVYGFVAWAGLTAPFLAVVGWLLRTIGSFPLRGNVVDSLVFYPWPEVKFPPRQVSVCPGVDVSLVPHIGEFDFKAQFSKSLGYEVPVFEALLSLVPQYDAIVEIGANVGVFSAFFLQLRASEQVPVYCFEPSAEAFRRLQENVGQVKNFHPIPAAVAQSSGLLSFYEPVGHLTNGSLSKEFAGIFSHQVRATHVPSVDGPVVAGLVGEHRSILLKIDVEGAEAAVLRSLTGLIRGKLPDIVLEVLEQFEAELNAIPFLSERYRFFLITEGGLVGKPRLIADPSARDYLLRPR